MVTLPSLEVTNECCKKRMAEETISFFTWPKVKVKIAYC